MSSVYRSTVQDIPDLSGDGERLFTIPGMVPSAYNFPQGCRFRDRCSFATDKCLEEPPLEEVSPGHTVACHHWREAKASENKES